MITYGSETNFDVPMGSLFGAEFYLIGLYILNISKTHTLNIGLYWGDGLVIIKIRNIQQLERLGKAQLNH